MFVSIFLQFLVAFSCSNGQFDVDSVEIESPEFAAASLGISLANDPIYQQQKNSSDPAISKREAKQNAIYDNQILKDKKFAGGKAVTNKTMQNRDEKDIDEDFLDELGNLIQKAGDKIEEQVKVIEKWAKQRGFNVEKIIEKLIAAQDKFVEELGGQADGVLRNISAITKEAGQKMLEVAKKTGGQNVEVAKKIVERN